MLIQVMIGMAMLTALAVQLPSVFENFNKSAKKAEVRLGVLAIKNQVSAYLETESIWEATFSHPQNNAVFDCIKTPANSCSSNSSFQIFNLDGDALTEAVASNPGFNVVGDTCTGFNLSNANKDCPIGITLSFEKICGTPCLRPSMKISANYQYSGVKGITLNTRNLSTKIFKPFSSSNILAHDAIYDSTAGSLYVHPTGVRMTRKSIQRTFFLDQEAIIIVSGSASATLLVAGPAGPSYVISISNALNLEINGQLVVHNRTTSLPRHPIAVNQGANRYLTSGWTQKVGPGNVTIELRYLAWVIWDMPVLSLPVMRYLNLAYTVIK